MSHADLREASILRRLLARLWRPPRRAACSDRSTRLLAERVAAAARQLSGLAASAAPSRDPVELLASTAGLLEDLVARHGVLHAAPAPTGQSPTALDAPPGLERPTLLPNTPLPVSAAPSATAQALMRLCDLLWIAQASGTALEAQAVTELVKELRAVLAYEGVTTLNATGLLDPMRQRVVGTQPTAAPQQHNQIAQTVRPGYQCGDHLLRPQDVIIARLAKPNPPEVHAT